MSATEKVPLTEKAYRQIKDQIITLALPPGSQLDENALAEKLSIGKTPVKGAILRLAGEGLVESAPARGYWVRNIGIEDIRALFEAMMISECPAMALAARRITDREIEALIEFNDKLQAAMDEPDFLAVTRLNGQFHRQIYQAARNNLLYSQLSHLQSLGQRLAFICFSELISADNLKKHYDKVIQDHRQMIEALQARDEKKIMALVRQHILLFHNRVAAYSRPTDIQHDNPIPAGFFTRS